MPKVKTITLDGGETAVKFPEGYPYYIITNLGDGELYASGNPGIAAYADGVYTVLPGTETRISPEISADTVYLLGEGKVQVRAEEIAVPTSFRAVQKGGDSYNVDLNTLLVFRGVVSPSTTVNLNDLTNPGYYLLNSNNASSFVNSPTTYVWGLLIVISISGNIFQFFFGNNDSSFFCRSKWFNGSFTSWRRI